MAARGIPQLATALLAVGILLAACGDGSQPAPPPTVTASPTATATATATPPAPTATPLPPPPLPDTTSGRPTAPKQSLCPDPYPNGAPYEPEPDEPIRLRPRGQPAPLARYQPLPFVRDAALERVVRQSLGMEAGRFAVVVKNLADGRGVRLAPNRSFYSASLFKTWVMLEVYHQQAAGLLDFDETYIVSDYYQERGLNAGELAACSQVTLGEGLAAMIRASDNVAAHVMLDRAGQGNVNATLRALGLNVSGYLTGLPTTAADMALLMEAMARRQTISRAASDEMLGLLSTTHFPDRLPALLPEGTRVAHKTGNWEDATHDAGVVFSPNATYVIVVLTDFGFADDGAARIARLSRAVYDFYN